MKQTLDKIKELLSNKRTRAATILGLYLIFFIFLGTMFRKNNANQNQYNNLINLNNYQSYNYSYEIKIDNTTTLISGTKYKNEELFVLNNKKYYIKDNKMFEYTDNLNEKFDYNFSFDVSKFTNDELYQYISNANLVNEDTTNGIIKKDYELSLTKFCNLYDESLVTSLGYITFMTYEKDKKIYKIEIDLTNYVNLDDNLDNYNVIIEISNINKIDGIEVE